LSYLLAFLGFAALVILHEAGHFAAAKAVGMRVERFSLFFGPLLVKFRRGETEYGIGPIPLGGYVKITGMSPREEIPEEVLPRAYYNQAVWKRIVVILAGPFVNLVIAFLILMGLFLSQGAVVTSHGQPVPVVASGTLLPPASSYLKPGDQILAVDGRAHPSATQLTAAIASHHCAGKAVTGCRATTPVRLTIKRGTQTQQLAITPRYDASIGHTRLGIEVTEAVHSVGPLSAAGHSLSGMWYVTHVTVTAFAKLFQPAARKQLHSVVGAYKVTQQEFASSTSSALETLALISLSLAVINLFPFLPLDGGHVFWALAEKLRRRRISFEVMERAGVIGFVLILLVFAIGLSNDISALTGSGFQTR
jgi:regulator of sigma E protease